MPTLSSSSRGSGMPIWPVLFWGSLWLIATLLVTPTSGGAIQSEYAATNASRFLQAVGLPYVIITANAGGNSNTTITLYPDYQFNTNFTASNSTAGRIYVPSIVTIPYPYCALTSIHETFVSAPSCANGLLLYGAYSIPPVPNESSVINGDTDADIQGRSVANVDQAGGSQYRGTVTWLRPGTCANSASFQLQWTIAGLVDVVDSTPVAITDSHTNITLYANVYGLGCSNIPRIASSPPIDPLPSFIPICRGVMPYAAAAGAGDLVDYTAMFGSSYIGPGDVPLGSIVYQLRIDALDPALHVHASVKFVYPDNTSTILDPLYPSYNDIIYVKSAGAVPARAYVCFYSVSCVPALAWNEVTLGYLPPCNCDSLAGNVVCNNAATNYTLATTVQRNNIPNWNTAIPFVPAPTCVFFINPGANGSAPVAKVPFQVQSGSSGGVGTIFYNWQLTNMPPSAGFIAAPNNVQTITATINAPGTYSITLTVNNANGVARTCTQSFVVVTNAPVACVSPTLVSNLVVGSFVTLDALCSSSPYGPISSYAWFISFQPGAGTGMLSSNTGPAVTFTSIQPGVYVVVVAVTNFASTATATSVIQVVAPASTPSSPSSPGSPSNSPTSQCYAPLPPYAIPQQPPQALAPLPIIPTTPPATPSPANPATQAPSFASNPALVISEESKTVAIAAAVLLLVVMVFAGCVSAFSGGGAGSAAHVATEERSVEMTMRPAQAKNKVRRQHVGVV